MTLAEIIKSLGKQKVLYNVNAVVKSVDKDNDTCDVVVIESGKEIPRVRLRACIDSSAEKLVIYPAVDSEVTVGFLFNKELLAVVISVSEVDEISIRGDAFGGLALTEKVAERIKRLEDSFEALQTKFNSHTHVLAIVGTTGTSAPTVVPSNEVVTPKTDQDYISNPKVKHG